MLTIKLTTDMMAEEIEPLWTGIIRCLSKYCDRYPNDEKVENIIAKCAAGDRQLWVVLDEHGEVVLAPITEIVRVDATGHKRLCMVELGGCRGVEAVPLALEIEKWAVETHGVTEVDWVGRKGWQKFIEPLGYRPEAVIYRKRL